MPAPIRETPIRCSARIASVASGPFDGALAAGTRPPAPQRKKALSMLASPTHSPERTDRFDLAEPPDGHGQSAPTVNPRC